ncbi:MAG: EFR1 family ferrodoxin [Candidatus Thermoplasmatota archaeon]|nr:EFR1 family ferrodoxin [Candidatus Thermoplasmatota archaeon]
MPSCALLYTSTTMNTKLACEHLTRRIPQVEFELFDMRDLTGFDPQRYTFVGFASYVDHQAPPLSFMEALSGLGDAGGKEAFVLLTYAALQGTALLRMADAVRGRGYRVIHGHALPMPENYPPQRKRGMKLDENPKDVEMDRFRQFIREIGDLIVTRELKGEVRPRKISVGLVNSLFRKGVRKDGAKGMGKKIVDGDLCTRCGACERNCPYGAIRMEDGPIFDEDRCHSCFSCYNHCHVGAITSEKVRTSDHRYSGPSEELKKRMSY